MNKFIWQYRNIMKNIFAFLAFVASGGIALADKPTIVNVKAKPAGAAWTFDVTVSHADTGWDHYADGWGVYLSDGTELGYRVLHHPHVNEMPFTRSLGGVKIPDGVTEVFIRPRDSVHGEGKRVKVKLPN